MMPAPRMLLQALLPVALWLLVVGIGSAQAQSLPADLPPDVLARLGHQLGNEGGSQSVVQSQASPLDLSQDQLQNYPGQNYQSQGGTVQTAPLPVSALETDYSQRAGVSLQQYGYDLFRDFRVSSGQQLAGGVPDDYRLGVGDTVVVSFRGQVSKSLSVQVDRDGQVVLPDLPPIAAAGRRFGDWRADLAAKVAAAYVNTDVFASLGAVRQVSVAVLGEVARPGMVSLGGFATVLDALALAGGIEKSGTLRRIAILHADGRRDTLDLYAVMGTGGAAPGSLAVEDGDRIEVGAIGPTVAIAGAVVRPGIYELPGSPGMARGISGAALLALGGEALRPEGNRFLRLSLGGDGLDHAQEYPNPARLMLGASDILVVSPRSEAVVGQVFLDGHVRLPGPRARLAAADVASLVGSPENLAEAPYMPLAILDTTDPVSRARHFVAIDLGQALSGETPVALRDGDVLIVLGADDIRYLASSAVQAVLNGQNPAAPSSGGAAMNDAGSAAMNGTGSAAANGAGGAAVTGAGSAAANGAALAAPADGRSETVAGASQEASAGSRMATAATSCQGLQTLAAVLATGDSRRFASAVELANSVASVPNNLACPSLYDRYPTLLAFVLEYATSLSGAVREPGIYPLSSGTTLKSVIAAAGGLSHDADLDAVEISHYADPAAPRQTLHLTPDDLDQVTLLPGDAIRIDAQPTDRETGPVTLAGEFVRPGVYDIRRGERLSELMARAGGLTPEAYPYGAVFTRISVQTIQRDATERSIRELESGLFTALQHTSSQQSASAQNAGPLLQQVVADMRANVPLGRVVIEADPAVLEVKPQLDLVLQPGDTLTMPKRPSYVTVSGEVLNPGAEEFMAGLDVSDYLRRAGGYTQNADAKHVFVIYPNGAAQPVRQAFWNFTPLPIPPGSTIIVPRNLSTYDTLSITTAIAQIVGQIALAGASLAVIGR